jgi:hypothetical protein
MKDKLINDEQAVGRDSMNSRWYRFSDKPMVLKIYSNCDEENFQV